MQFDELLKTSRKKQKLSLLQLERLSGVPRSTIYSYECGTHPTIDKADKLLRALGVTCTLGKEETHAPPGY